MSLVSDILNQAFVNLRVIPSGGTVGNDMQVAAFARLNQLLANLSTEGAMCFNQVIQSFALLASTSTYTLGAAGTFATTGGLRAQKVTGWRAISGDMAKGGAVLPLAEFGEASAAKQQALAELYKMAVLEGVIATVPATLTAPIPSVLAADTSFPSINIRIFPPPPATGMGNVELAYWTPIPAFATVGDTVSLAPGYEQMLTYNLAVFLYPEYGDREQGLDPVLAQNAQQSKLAIIQQNTILMQQQSAPAAAPQVAA
jgi:hypothetical protein